jgi:hypothetical protein
MTSDEILDKFTKEKEELLAAKELKKSKKEVFGRA